MTTFRDLVKFFKQPLPRAHQPVSESTCSSRRWEVGAEMERGEERHSQFGNRCLSRVAVRPLRPPGLP